MEKVDKKEIRVIFNLKNEKDNNLYHQILEISKTQPGRVMKRIVAENIENEGTNQNQTENNVNLKLLTVLDKLCDKIDNLTVVQDTDSKTTNFEKNKNNIQLSGNVAIDDINDIKF